MSELTLVRLYHDLLGTYGDAGNTEVLVHRAAARGYAISVIDIEPGQPVPQNADFYLIGGGEDGPQTAALELLRVDGGLNAGVRNGATVLAVCAGFQLIGTTLPASGVSGVSGTVSGLGLIDAETFYTADPRSVGEIVTIFKHGDDKGAPNATRATQSLVLTGFENHQGFTRLGPEMQPLGTVSRGIGNGVATVSGIERPEGVLYGKVFGTYLHGPVLARNPQLADIILESQLGELSHFQDDLAEALAAERRHTLQK